MIDAMNETKMDLARESLSAAHRYTRATVGENAGETFGPSSLRYVIAHSAAAIVNAIDHLADAVIALSPAPWRSERDVDATPIPRREAEVSAMSDDRFDVRRFHEALEFARRAHDGQLDKGGEPYFDHVARVGLLLLTDDVDMDIAVAGVLHDVLEDCPEIVMLDLERAFGVNVAELVSALTRRHGETYADYIRRVGSSRVTIKLKLTDLADNLHPARAAAIDDEQRARYHWAVEGLLHGAGPSVRIYASRLGLPS